MSHSSTEPTRNDKAARSESSGARSHGRTETRVSSEPNSSTTSHPRASVPASEFSCTPVRYDLISSGRRCWGGAFVGVEQSRNGLPEGEDEFRVVDGVDLASELGHAL